MQNLAVQRVQNIMVFESEEGKLFRQTVLNKRTDYAKRRRFRKKCQGSFSSGKINLFNTYLALIIVGTVKYIPFASRSSLYSMLQLSNEIEESADDFAAKVLAPACVLWALKVKDAKEIENLCLIPPLYARRRAERMAELYKRENKFLAQRGYSCFLTSALEKKVYENFTDYIGEMKKMRQNKFLAKIKRAIK